MMVFKSIRTFIGAINVNESRSFYNDLGFKEVVLSKTLSYFKINNELGFYLQDYNVKDWIDNSMLFLEVEDVETYFMKLQELNLTNKYPSIKLSKVVSNDWGKEFFLHDPAGILWHIGCFY